MVNELLGKQYNMAKANRTDRKVQNLAGKKRVSAQDLRNRRIRRYFVCRLKRSEARDFSHVRFSSYKKQYRKIRKEPTEKSEN
mgnify:CR=1 FL=1